MGGAKLRNANYLQHACLTNTGTLIADEGLEAICETWKDCLRGTDGQSTTHIADLVSILEAAGAHHEHHADASTDTSGDTEGCIYPPLQDPEEWECDCLENMMLACEEGVSQTECLHTQFCDNDAVCASWKAAECSGSANFVEKKTEHTDTKTEELLVKRREGVKTERRDLSSKNC